jgi:putative transposase
VLVGKARAKRRMPRKPLILSNECVYHLTNRSNNREWFYLPIDGVWEVFCETLSRACTRYETEIQAFVLMSNHYHLLLATRHGDLHRFMRYFQTEACREIQRRSGRINHVFGTRYKWSALWDSFGYAVATKYVFRNPVKAGIVSAVQAYPYSSIHWEARTKLSIFERTDVIARQVPKHLSERLEWLNTPTSKEADELVRRGLRRTEFSLAKGRAATDPQDLVSARYRVDIETAHPLPFGQE